MNIINLCKVQLKTIIVLYKVIIIILAFFSVNITLQSNVIQILNDQLLQLLSYPALLRR